MYTTTSFQNVREINCINNTDSCDITFTWAITAQYHSLLNKTLGLHIDAL